jgi:transketolase
LFTGSGDLTGNTGMNVKSLGVFTPDDASGRLIHYGIREHGMSAAANAMAVSGLLPCVGTFFTFSDYMRPAVRLAALMRADLWEAVAAGPPSRAA